MESAVPASPHTTRVRSVRRFVGGFYLTMAGVNLGIIFADPETYRHFADDSYLAFVTQQWQDIVMANPSLWGLLLAIGEIALGSLLLVGGRAARIGWVGVFVFHVLLMLFGLGIWFWSLPVLAVLIPVARADWPDLGIELSKGTPHVDAGR
jgi:hypothetical protein